MKHTPKKNTAKVIEQPFRALIEYSADAISLIDITGKVLYESPSYQRIMGYPVDQRLGRNTFELVHPDDQPKMQQIFSDVLTSTKPVIVTPVRVRHSNGTWRWIEGVGNNMLQVPEVNAIVVNFRDITDRIHTQEALRQSEEKFRSITEQIRDVIAIIDAVGSIIFISPSSNMLFDLTPDEMCGKKFTDFLDTTSVPLAIAMFHKSFGQGIRTRNLELVFKRKDGTTFTGELNGSDFNDGVKKGILVDIRDITDRIKAEKALRESERRLRLLSDNFPGGLVYQVDTGLKGDERVITYISAGVVKLHGITQAAVLADSGELYGQIHEEDLAELMQLEVLAINEMKTFQAEVRFKMPSGKVRWSYLSSSPRKLDNGHLVWDGIELDITDRKNNEAAQQRASLMHRMIAENAVDVLWTYNLSEERFTFVSDSVFTLRGYTPEEVMHQSMKEALTEESYLYVEKMINEKMVQRKPGDTTPFIMKSEIAQPCKDGSIIVTEAVSTTIFNNEGIPFEILGISRDITEKLKYQESVQRADKLEAVGLLAGGIAHDFNNLLSGIYGYLNLALLISKEPLVREYLDDTVATMNRARALTQQLLTFSKGGVPVRQIYRLNDFLEETVKFALSGSNVSCKFDLEDRLWSCEFDRNQIAQVIDNLVINAQQAMPLGGVITITGRNVMIEQDGHLPLKCGKYVRVSIEDLGIGIPPEILPKIFDPFFSTKTKGHGLGLATCFSILNRHDGFIEVDSEPGKGSVFHVYLPAAEMAGDGRNEHSGDYGHRGNGTIVLMDDEAVVRNTIGAILRSFGYRVVLKENGAEAVAFFREARRLGQPVTAFIFDLTVAGGMGGAEAVGEIRQIDRDTPIFVMSGYAEDPIMAFPIEYGFTASICKPFSVGELVRLLQEHLNKTDQ